MDRGVCGRRPSSRRAAGAGPRGDADDRDASERRPPSTRGHRHAQHARRRIATLSSAALRWGRVFFCPDLRRAWIACHRGLRSVPSGLAGWRAGGRSKTDGERHGLFDIENFILIFGGSEPGVPRLRLGPPATRAVKSRCKGGSSRSAQDRRGPPPLIEACPASTGRSGRAQSRCSRASPFIEAGCTRPVVGAP